MQCMNMQKQWRCRSGKNKDLQVKIDHQGAVAGFPATAFRAKSGKKIGKNQLNKGKTSSIMKNVNNGYGSKRLAWNADAENRKRFLASAFFKSRRSAPNAPSRL